MAFKRPTSTTTIPTDPEQLYRQLALINMGRKRCGCIKAMCCGHGTATMPTTRTSRSSCPRAQARRWWAA